MNNLFTDIPNSLPEELFETLVQADNIRIERIASHGHASPEGYVPVLPPPCCLLGKPGNFVGSRIVEGSGVAFGWVST